MRISTGPVVLATAVAGLYIAFFLWYGGRDRPLSPAEARSLLAAIESSFLDAPGARPDLRDSLARFAEADDGNEFYMVNLVRHRPKALYPPGTIDDEDVDAAERRYARGILPRLLRHGALPIFLGTPRGWLLQPEGADEWDQVVLVRYRSRRDLLEMVAEPGMAALSLHKWASVEKTQVFPVTPVLSLVWIRSGVAVACALAGGLLHGALRHWKMYLPNV